MLPPEIRLIIYRHLLVSNDFHIRYSICPSNKGLRIVARDNSYTALKLYPEILKTCHLINQEATLILYGENVFAWEFFWPKKLQASNIHCL